VHARGRQRIPFTRRRPGVGMHVGGLLVRERDLDELTKPTDQLDEHICLGWD
jgi:hypothetical protein